MNIWFLKVDFVHKVCVCMCVCVCVHHQGFIVIISDTIWHDMKPYDWLNKFYSLWMAAVVCIVNRRCLTIEARCTCRSQPNKIKLALYKPLLHLYSHLKQLYISNKTKRFSYKGLCGVCGSKHIKAFKEELAWATD